MARTNPPTSQMKHADFQRKKCDMYIAAYAADIMQGLDLDTAARTANFAVEDFSKWFAETSGIEDEMNATKYVIEEGYNGN